MISSSNTVTHNLCVCVLLKKLYVCKNIRLFDYQTWAGLMVQDNNVLAFNEVLNQQIEKNIDYYNSKRTCLLEAFWISSVASFSVNVYKFGVKQAGSDR